jgi:hypothetical protein
MLCTTLLRECLHSTHKQAPRKREFKKHGVIKRAVRSLKDATTWSRSDMAFLLKYYGIAICGGLCLGLVFAQYAQTLTQGTYA